MRFAIAALFAVTITGCSPPAAVAPSLTPSAAVPTVTPAPTPAATASPASTRSPAATPTPITELAQVFRQLTSGWRPTGPTLMFSTNEDTSRTLIAVPFGPGGRIGEPTRLVSFTGQGGGWDLRPDGGALAIAAGGRIATWDIAAGTARWVTPADPSVAISSPLWSKDGRAIFFSSLQAGGAAAAERIDADGRGRATIATPDRFGGLEGLTPDGRGLIWTRVQAGGSAEILDVATGTSRHLDDVARVVSWRAQQPRILLAVGGCCAGRPGGSLVAFDDLAMTSRVVAERTAFGLVAYGGGAWDPTGTRIAVARYDESTQYDATLAIVNAETGTVQPISDVLGVGTVLWLPEGIVVTQALTRSPMTDLALVPAQGGPSVALYRGSGIGRVVVVRP